MVKVISQTPTTAEIIDDKGITRHVHKEFDGTWRYRSPELKKNGQPKHVFEYPELDTEQFPESLKALFSFIPLSYQAHQDACHHLA